MPKKVLVTGASGFVGANLARRLLEDGHELHLLLRPGYRRWRIEDIEDDVRRIELDMLDAPALRTRVARIRPDWIFHLATHGAYASQTDARRIVETNLTSTIHLVEACAETGFEAFVNSGSSSEYGLKAHPPTEAEALEPNSTYAVTKAAATAFCRHAARKWKLNLTTLRLYSAYGPFEEPSRLMPQLILLGLERRLPPLASPRIARDYVHVGDVVDAYRLAATRPGAEPGAVFNLGTGVQTTLEELVALNRRVFDIEAEPEWGSMPDRDWDTEIWQANPRKIREHLGWRPKHDLESGLRAMTVWLQSDEAMLSYYRRVSGAG